MSSLENDHTGSFTVPRETAKFFPLPERGQEELVRTIVIIPRPEKRIFGLFKPYEISIVFFGLKNTRRHGEIIWGEESLISGGAFITRRAARKAGERKAEKILNQEKIPVAA